MDTMVLPGAAMPRVIDLPHGDADERRAAMAEMLPFSAPATEDRRYLQWLLVPDRGEAIALPVSQIDWIAAEDNYLSLHAGTRVYLIRETMERMSAMLDPAAFLRIHRSTLVNLHRVKALRRWGGRDYVVVMENGTELRMSRRYERSLNTTIGDYR
jgi:two-component system LytT family response regulator